jgi:flavorubredoxin
MILDLYDKWSKYEPEKEGVVIFYGSMYGNTANTADALANKLGQRGVKDIRVYDVSKTHPSYIISDIWKYSHLVAAAPTYNMGLYYPMDNLLHEMAALGVKNRKVAIIGNHSWASAAQKLMTERFSSMKNMEIIGETFDIKSRLKDDEEQKLDDLADVIAASVLGNTEE